ncbi:helix-turn-helix transcriptional regulator [Pseudomonas cavernicola]|uniref:Helix-turn-helix transcriptional regulator n=1 Tax=Pseudomonas cavernicola TaxID=2320866 RepID=A0A418X8X9_9PSED|nr:LuxR C-terminal-related transcriptional regulator [Pseudomonas cavernicola]RJG08934.1 helix-turn-helix transcriptional regulator [Pseudomonas cavernicola]
MALPALKPNQLRPPAEPAKALARPRLLQQLASSLAAGCFTLLQAPLGYGKSTLLGQFARTLPGRSAWLRLTPAENQPLGLLVHLHAALGLPAAQRATADAEGLWSEIQHCLESASEPLTLLLDDLQLLNSPPAYQYLEQLLHFPPPALRLLAASEGPPRLPLAHLRRDGRLTLIDIHELALDSEETRQLAAARDVRLSADAIYQLRAGSEGWISGVLFWLDAYHQAASLGQPPADLRPVTVQAYAHARQFLEEERLRRLKPELLGFLERTAVVQVFDAALAAELSGRADASEAIRQLRRLDLFIEERAGERSEYRYHPALRNSLYQRLAQRDPQRLRQLHRQAANWLLEQRRFTEAIYQFGRARDFDAVLATVDRHTFDLLREGQVNALIDFLGEVAGHAGSDSFTLAITEASTIIVTNDVAQTCQCIRRLQGLLRRQGIPRHPQRVQQTIAFLRSRLAYLGGNLAHGLEVAGRALQRFPQHNAASSVLHFDRASCLFALGRLDEARDEAELALGELQGFGLSGYTNLIQLLLGQIELAQGCGEAAWQRFLALDELPASSSASFYELFHHLGKGLALLQANQLEQARQCLNQAEVLALDFPHCAALAWVFHHQAGLYWAQGQTHQAKARWDEVRRMARQYRLFTLYRQAGAWRARLAVREDDQDFLLDWLEEWHWCFRHYGEHLLPEEWLAYAWVQRHLGQHGKAWQIHANLKEQAQIQANRRLQLDALLLEAGLFQDRGARTEALGSLEQALQLASRYGFGQLLQYEGDDQLESLRELLLPQTRAQLGLAEPAPPRERLNALFRRLLAGTETAASALIVPLSRRELDVLQRMARGQTNQQIADALFISLSTVKTHINHLFRKLDVTDRDSALRSARELELLG